MGKFNADRDYYADLEFVDIGEGEETRSQRKRPPKAYHPNRNPRKEGAIVEKPEVLLITDQPLSDPTPGKAHTSKNIRVPFNLSTRHHTHGDANLPPSPVPWTGYGSLANHPKGTIRLLELKPGRKNENIKAFLRPALLRAKYSAVSYTWGTEAANCRIRLNTKYFYIRQNLFNCLLHLRHPTQSILLWIDAICVNQNDLEERESQVKLMDQIFGQAKAVLVWLGVDQREGELEDSGQSQADNHEQREIPCAGPRHGDSVAAAMSHDQVNSSVTKKLSTRSQLLKITELCQRQYWTRLWIVQEVILAQKITIHYGKNQQSWNQFIAQCRDVLAEDRIKSTEPPPDKTWLECRDSIYASRILGIDQDRDTWHRKGGHHLPLGVLFLTYGKNNCSDPRDKIYAMLSMASRSKASSTSDAIPVSYTISNAELFLRLAKLYGFLHPEFLVELQESLSLTEEDIAAAHLSKSKGARHDQVLVPFPMREVARVRALLYSTLPAPAKASPCAHVLLIEPVKQLSLSFEAVGKDYASPSLEAFKVGSDGPHLAVVHCEQDQCTHPKVGDSLVAFGDSRVYAIYSPNAMDETLVKKGIAYPLPQTRTRESFLACKGSEQDADIIMPPDITLLDPAPTDLEPVFGKAWIPVADLSLNLGYHQFFV